MKRRSVCRCVVSSEERLSESPCPSSSEEEAGDLLQGSQLLFPSSSPEVVKDPSVNMKPYREMIK